MANPRRRSRALRYFGAAGWPVGLPETIVRATAKAAATASLALASVVLALGSGRTGFLETSFRAMQSGGVLDAAAVFVVSSLCRNMGGPGDGQSFGDSLPRARFRRFGAGGGWTGFPKQVSERCEAGGSWTPPRHMRPKAYVATRAAQPSGPSATEQGYGRSGGVLYWSFYKNNT